MRRRIARMVRRRDDRSLAMTATTERIKTRLIEEAEEHERIARLAEYDPEGLEQ
jgi:hypothetical protein